MEASRNLTGLPPCPKVCIQASCSLTDLACICQSKAQDALEKCLMSSCSIPEGYYTRKHTNIACKVPVNDHGAKLNIMCVTLGGVALFCIIARILFKRYLTSKKRLDKDDWTIMSAIPTGFTLVGLVVFGLNMHGFGVDIWGLSDQDIMMFGTIFYLVSMLYIVLMTQIKLSLCFFYLNIFPGDIIRRLLWVTVYFHIASAVAFSLAVLFSCTPFSFQWKRYDLSASPLSEGNCVDFNVAGWSYSVINVVSDLWLIAMPLTQVGLLNLHIKKKIGIVLMFLTGALVTIISFLRLNTNNTYNNTTNPTWDEWSLVWWSAIEVCTGFICTSLPTIRLILIHIAPRTFDSDRLSSQEMARKPRTRGSSKQQMFTGLTLPTMNFKGSGDVTVTQSQRGLCDDTESIGRSDSPV